ncbi:MAG: hypothetical protein NUV42_02280 [Candidatus Yonathbacteria bacterium]|nr:hypothetical protein [Candidatus Yonathbacteria bacterium]
MEQKEKTRLIRHLVESYNSGERAARLGIVYLVINKTFSIEIEDKQYPLTANQLADLPDGIGDEFAGEIKSWAQGI